MTIQTLESPQLALIEEKVELGSRLTAEEGLYLLTEAPEEELYRLANRRRELIAGDTVYFASTQYIHPTNLCELSCPMCSYYAKPGWESAWFNTPQEIEETVRAALPKGVTEIHFVGGLWRECDLDYYKDAFSRIQALDSSLHIKALTGVEYHFLSKLHNITIKEVFDRMISYGLQSLPGGGAEILVEKVRKQVAPQKITSQEYLDVHAIAHRLGLRSNITMLFGHVEDHEDIIAHLEAVREAQDRTGGFQTFVPLKYHIENNALGKRTRRLKPKNIPRLYATSRLMLDNVRNVKVLWNYLGVKQAMEILQAGGNDLGATALDEKIVIMAGGTQVKMTPEGMSQLISSLGRTPKQIHSGYDYSEDDCT